jgi:ectoine hydroxylase-related dioxygenase (phytanoyl-CoA dioxygenase family)
MEAPHLAALLERGFAVIEGPHCPGIASAYDRAMASGESPDLKIASSTRLHDIVNRGPEFDAIYIHPPLLEAVRRVVGPHFRLSGSCLRTLEPGAPEQPLHVDVRYGADGWPIIGFILMVDGFDEANGATRFVPGSHTRRCGPEEACERIGGEVLACGPAGSMLVFDGSVWHGHSSNRSQRRRRSIQGHFISRDATAALDYAARMRPETAARLGELARYVLGA